MSLSEKYADDTMFLEAVAYRAERCGNFPDDMVKDQARLLEIIRKPKRD